MDESLNQSNVDSTEILRELNATEEYILWNNYRLEFALAIASVIAILTDILTITAILRHSCMRTRSNIYIVNWRISTIIGLILMPSVVLIENFESSKWMNRTGLCILEEIMFNQLFSSLAFASVLLLDWYIIMYSNQKCSLCCRNSSKFIIATFWIFSVSMLIWSSYSCAAIYLFPWSLFTYVFGYPLVFIFILIMHMLRCIKKKTSSVVVEKDTLPLTLVTAFFLCWLPNCLAVNALVFFRYIPSHFFEFCTWILGYCCSEIIFYLMWRKDEKFRESCKALFRRRKHRNEEEFVNEADGTILI